MLINVERESRNPPEPYVYSSKLFLIIILHYVKICKFPHVDYLKTLHHSNCFIDIGVVHSHIYLKCVVCSVKSFRNYFLQLNQMVNISYQLFYHLHHKIKYLKLAKMGFYCLPSNGNSLVDTFILRRYNYTDNHQSKNRNYQS